MKEAGGSARVDAVIGPEFSPTVAFILEVHSAEGKDVSGLSAEVGEVMGIHLRDDGALNGLLDAVGRLRLNTDQSPGTEQRVD